MGTILVCNVGDKTLDEIDSHVRLNNQTFLSSRQERHHKFPFQNDRSKNPFDYGGEITMNRDEDGMKSFQFDDSHLIKVSLKRLKSLTTSCDSNKWIQIEGSLHSRDHLLSKF